MKKNNLIEKKFTEYLNLKKNLVKTSIFLKTFLFKRNYDKKFI